MSFLPGMDFAPKHVAREKLTSLTFVAQAGVENDVDIVVHSDIRLGDLLIWITVGGGYSGTGFPPGFTLIQSFAGHADFGMRFGYKVCDGSEKGQNLAVDTSGGTVHTGYIPLRPAGYPRSVTYYGAEYTSSGNDPSSSLFNGTGATGPLLAIGILFGSGGITGEDTAGYTAQTVWNIRVLVAYHIVNSGAGGVYECDQSDSGTTNHQMNMVLEIR